MRIWLAFLALILTAPAAHAGPVFVALVANGVGVVSAAMASLGAIGTFLAKIALSAAASRLSMLLKGKPRSPGITTEVTTTGGVTPQSFIMGLYATGGQMLAPANSYGTSGKTPRAFLVYPIVLSVVPGCTLQRIILNDAYVTLGAPAANWGRPATGDLSAVLMVDYRDGSQVAAHPDLLAAFSADPDRPWAADMVGPGLCYAVTRFKYDREKFNGLPSARFEVMGIPLYDPRADSTVGGSGAQRWANRATWTQSSNPAVMIYNIMRGIDVGAGMVWGGGIEAEDLPLAGWFAAMNKCDVAIAKPGGATEPQFRAGVEVRLSDEPASVIEELLKTCLGQVVEVGGVWDIQIGDPDLPSYFITDDDILISKGQEFDPFPPISDTFNGITASYPEPLSLWEPKEAPPRYSATWEAEDGGRRLVADLQMPACPYPSQVQRVMTAAIADHRRFRRHQFALLPEAAILVPLTTISWTSARYGYTAKVFEIGGLTDHLMTMHQGLSVRERDSGDFAWSIGDYKLASAPAATTTAPMVQVVAGWAAAGEGILDSDGVQRRSGIRLSWDADGADDAWGLQWELRLAGTVDAQLGGTHSAVTTGTVLIAEGVVAGQGYEARAQYLVDRATTWSAWEAVTAPAVLITAPDIAPESIDDSHILALNADKINAGFMDARHLRVTEMLEINSVTGAFSLGKSSAFDLSSDGIYMGRTDDGGTIGFGFLAGKQIGGLPQYLQITSQEGLRVVNARHYVSSIAAPTPVIVTTSQTIALPIGTKVLDVELLGGGGGGAGATTSGASVAIAAANGTATTIQLWDGATNTGISWSSAGGLGATAIHNADNGYPGASSNYGAGGSGGPKMNSAGGTPQHGGNATGYGAGGGGGGGTEKGGDGGGAAVVAVTLNHDVSALAAPTLVIVIGTGGAGTAGQGGAGNGGAGSAGRVEYRARTLELTPANVLPLQPTFTGSIVKAGGAAMTFPAYGAGLWVLSVTTAVNLDLGLIETHLSGTTVRVLTGSSVTFVSDKTPVDLFTSAGAYTVEYQFFKLSEWA